MGEIDFVRDLLGELALAKVIIQSCSKLANATILCGREKTSRNPVRAFAGFTQSDE